MRVVKTLFRIVLVVLFVVLIAAGLLYHLSTRLPEGYNPHGMTPEARADFARRMEDKWGPLSNYAAKAQSDAAKARTQPAATAPAPESLTLAFTQDELNAVMWKWTDNQRSRYERYIKDPFIRLDSDRLILMGTVPEFDKVLSLHFVPFINEQGMLCCNLAAVRVGSLPLPEKLFEKQRAKLENLLRSRLPQWQNTARIDSTGKSNADASAAAMTRLVLQMLAREPAPAVLFLPTSAVQASQPVPLRLTHVDIVPGEMTITVRPLTPEEITTTLGSIRKPLP